MPSPTRVRRSRWAGLADTAASLLALALLLVGLPIVLTTVLGWAIPRRWPSVGAWRAFAAQPLEPHYVVAMVAALGWLVWAAMVAAVLLQVLAAITRIRAPRIRLLAPFQQISTALLGGVSLTATGLTHLAAPPPAITTPMDTTPAATPAGVGIETTAATVTDRGTAAVVSLQVGDQHYTVTVAKGDNLSHIARDWLGDPDRWTEIYQLNRGRTFPDVGGRLTNPNLIYPGWTLDLPADARPPGTTQPQPAAPAAEPNPAASNPADRPAPAQSPAIAPSAGVALPTTPVTEPSTAAGQTDPDGVISQPAPPASASPVASSNGPAASSSPAEGAGQQHDDGVDLPGGWITLPFAVALTAAVAMLWRRRQHRWIPEPFDADPDDADLRPLPAVVARIRRAVRPEALHRLADPPASQPVHADPAPVADTDDGPVAPPPIAPNGISLAGFASTVPASGLGLTGPGAQAAARALLVATLSAGEPGDPDACGQVVIPSPTLTSLLGTETGDTAGMPRCTVTTDLPEALLRIEEVLIARRRTLLDEDANDLAEMRATDPNHPPMPPIVLIADTPAQAHAARVASTLHLGADLQISGVLLGHWPRGQTITINAAGHTDGPRFSVLDQTTAADLIAVLREAHTGTPASSPPSETEPTAADACTEATAKAEEPSPGTTPAEPEDPWSEDADEPTGAPSLDATVSVGPPPVANRPDGRGAAPSPDEASSTLEAPNAGSVVVGEAGQHRQAVIRVLGVPSIFDAQGTPIPTLRYHAQQLLVYLVVFRPGADRSRICRTFWPTAEQRLAGASLNTEASELRRYIRQAVGDRSINPLINPGGRYILNPDTVTVDAWTMVDALTDAKHATDLKDKIAALWRAVNAHTGILAKGCDYDWIAESRERMRRRGIRARISLADLLAEDEPEHAADLLRTAADLDPYSDHTAGLAMRAYARLGDVEAIRGQFDQLRNALDEINEQPAGETAALATTLIRQQAGTSRQTRSDDG